MNYRHAFHAGNFADVVKHVALTAILLHLKKKTSPFAIIDTHAGAGLYEIGSGDAARTGEAENGIGRLGEIKDGPLALLEYLALVRSFGPANYPGSPLIAARLKRASDRIVAVERHREAEESLARVLKPFVKSRAVEGDGYAKLAELLPPPERRGLIVVDPPFEQESEFSDIAASLASALKRFSTGIYLIWFPAKSEGDADALSGELLASGAARLLRVDVDTVAGTMQADGSLRACGLLVVNPPFGFAEEMREALAILAPRLGAERGRGAEARVTILAAS